MTVDPLVLLFIGFQAGQLVAVWALWQLFHAKPRSSKRKARKN